MFQGIVNVSGYSECFRVYSRIFQSIVNVSGYREECGDPGDGHHECFRV